MRVLAGMLAPRRRDERGRDPHREDRQAGLHRDRESGTTIAVDVVLDNGGGANLSLATTLFPVTTVSSHHGDPTTAHYSNVCEPTASLTPGLASCGYRANMNARIRPS